MKYSISILTACTALALVGCKSTPPENNVVSQRYVHKYGYAVSKEDWDANEYPGQLVTQLRNGVTVTSTYEGGVLHGPTTHTFPHSQTVEHFYLYNQGSQVKETHYHLDGMPTLERVQLSPSRYAVTMWYREGSPMLMEEFVGNELLEGQYFSTSNEIESRIEKGNGVRVRRNIDGLLLAKETFEQGVLNKQELFYANGLPHQVAHYYEGELHGEKSTFGEHGEPLSVEEYVGGKLHGLSTYFHNGVKYKEVSYLYGQKNGLEKHYLDGQLLTEAIAWENDLQHGSHEVYTESGTEQRWYYAGDLVSQKKFDELNRLDTIISQIQ